MLGAHLTHDAHARGEACEHERAQPPPPLCLMSETTANTIPSAASSSAAETQGSYRDSLPMMRSTRFVTVDHAPTRRPKVPPRVSIVG